MKCSWFFLLLILVLLSSTPKLFAQADSTNFTPRFAVGLQYGNGFNDVRFAPTVNQEQQRGTRIALAFRYESERNLGVALELAYETRGWRETLDSFSSTYLREIDYIDFAAFTHITIGEKNIKPVIMLGPYLAFPLTQRESIPSDWTSANSYYGEDLPNRLQYGLTGGLGVEWQLGKWSVQLDGRYRSALGGLFETGDNRFTFSNLKGLQAEATLLYWLK